MEDSIRLNIGFCIKNTCNIVDLITCLIQENVLTNDERQGIMNCANNYAKIWELYEILMRKDEKYHKSVKRALIFSGNSLISCKLEEDIENSLWRVKYPRIEELKMNSCSVQLCGKPEHLALLKDIHSDIEKTVGVLHLKWVDADTVQLIDALNQCSRLSFLHLENVKMKGNFEKRVCLPSLKDFVFNDDEDFVGFFDETSVERREARLRTKIILFRTHDEVDSENEANGNNDKFSDCKCNIFVSISSITIVKVNRLTQVFHMDMVAQNHYILEGNEEKPEMPFVELPKHLNPPLITKISIKFSIGIDAFSFPTAVSQCINLRSLELVMVKVVGRFISRAFLPKLQKFYYDDLTDCSDDIEGRKNLEEYLKTTQIKSILFFNKYLDELWNISDLWSFRVNVNVIVKGVTLIRIDHNLRELVCGITHPNETDKILRGVPSNISKLSLRDCVIGEDHVPRGVQELILFRVEGCNNDIPGLIKSCSNLTHLSLYTNQWIHINFFELPKTLSSMALFNVCLNSGGDREPFQFALETALLLNCDICKALYTKQSFRDFCSADTVCITQGKYITLPELRTAFRFYKFWSNESFEGRSHEPLTLSQKGMAVDASRSPNNPSPSPPTSDISDSNPSSEDEG